MSTTGQPNPYEYVGSDSAEPPPFEVDGQLLVVSRKVILPDYCVYTGEPTRWVHRVWKQLAWFEKWYKGKSCGVRMGMTWPFRLRLWGWAGGVVVIALLLIGALTLLTRNAWWVMSLATLLLLPILLWLGRAVEQKSGLKVVRYEDGRFWIEGFAPEFLERLKADENRTD